MRAHVRVQNANAAQSCAVQATRSAWAAAGFQNQEGKAGMAHEGVVVEGVRREGAVHDRVALGGRAGEEELGAARDAGLRVQQRRAAQLGQRALPPGHRLPSCAAQHGSAVACMRCHIDLPCHDVHLPSPHTQHIALHTGRARWYSPVLMSGANGEWQACTGAYGMVSLPITCSHARTAQRGLSTSNFL